MANIYEIREDFLRLQEVAETGGIDKEVLDDTLDSIESILEDKAENYGLIIKNLENETAGLKAEADRLMARYKAVNNNIGRIKERLSENLLAMGKTKLKTDHFSFSFRNSKSVKITDQDALLEDYIKEKTTYTVDKVSIKEALKSGQTVKGAELIERQNLQIK